jgi:hypothetical protein
MSASTEIILEKIKDAEAKLNNAGEHEAELLKGEIKRLNELLTTANKALTENKQLLKD